jgi:hypothetical protein
MKFRGKLYCYKCSLRFVLFHYYSLPYLNGVETSSPDFPETVFPQSGMDSHVMY